MDHNAAISQLICNWLTSILAKSLVPVVLRHHLSMILPFIVTIINYPPWVVKPQPPAFPDVRKEDRGTVLLSSFFEDAGGQGDGPFVLVF